MLSPHPSQDKLADFYGRLRAVMVGSSIFTLGVIVQGAVICAAYALGREELWRDTGRRALAHPVFPCMSGLSIRGSIETLKIDLALSGIL